MKPKTENRQRRAPLHPRRSGGWHQGQLERTGVRPARRGFTDDDLIESVRRGWEFFCAARGFDPKWNGL